MEQQHILNNDAPHKTICVEKLAKLEQKLQNTEKREDTEAIEARSAITAATVISSKYGHYHHGRYQRRRLSVG